MNKIDKDCKIDVEALMSKLLQRKITKDRFKFPLTEQQAVDMLTASYMAEVAYRNGTFIADPDTKNNIARLAKFLTAEGRKFGFMLCGVCGNGKTTLLYAFRAILSYLSDNNSLDGPAALRIIDAKEVSQYVRDLKAFDTLRKAPMVAIEDMGREPAEILDYGNVLNPVTDLVEYRYNAQLFTAVTTNLTPQQVSEKYGKRIADRFNEMLAVIIFKNGSYRK